MHRILASVRAFVGTPFVVLGIALTIFGAVVGGIGEWKIERLDDDRQ